MRRRLAGSTKTCRRAHQLLNLAGVLLPFVGFVAAIVLLWDQLRRLDDLAVLAIMYVLTGLGVTLGFHRLLTHRSFQTYKPVQYALATLGSMAVQGPVMSWVADHRKHHAHTDQEGDPHSPARPRRRLQGRGRRPLVRAHGLAVRAPGQAEHARYARDLYEDRGMRCIHRRSALWVLLGIAIPAALGFALTGTLARRARPALWGGAVRIFLLPPRHLVDQLGLPLLRHAGASPSTTTRPTSSGSRRSRLASPGTTTTTRSRARPSTGSALGDRPDRPG